MASVGDADAILIMSWLQGVQTNVLIDGGTKSDYPAVKALLKDFGVTTLDHVVNSHPHGDHQGGLIELAKDTAIVIRKAWMHFPWKFLDFTKFREVLSEAGERRRAKQLSEAFESCVQLWHLWNNRRIPIFQPFTNSQIGPFTVAGPTESFYSDRLHEFDELSEIIAEDEWRKQQDSAEKLAEFAELLGMESTVSTSLEDNPETEPENNTSTILVAKVIEQTVVLTADAGVPALLAAANALPMRNCTFMQIPHHGSRHNISPFLVEYFRPKTAFVSAVGNKKHPGRSVVNAFKAVGTNVYGTHYPKPSGLAQSYGQTPPSPWTSSADSLWNS